MMLNRLSLNRIGLNRIGLNRIGKPSGGSSDRPYIDPKVLDSLCGVWIMDQNTNESESRNIIKNKIADRGGDLELLNFGYKLNSGYNGYATDFTEWHGTYSNKTQTKITVSIDIYFPISIIYFKNVTSAPSFRIKVSGLPKGQNLYYKYINEEGLLEEKFNIPSDGIYTLPATAVSDTPTTVATLANERYNINIKGLTIEQLPLYEGALVTDGKDDMIVSQKTVQEMLGGSKEITVVSMIHQIGRVATNTNLFTNCIQYNTGSKGHNIVNYQTSLGKTGIYGYSRANVSVANNEVVINNILGDKADYLTNVSIGALTSNEKFSVVGYLDVSPQQVTSVAVYWTFISNKVLTTDEINQIIAYFKLDKYVTPQVIYDVKRQGLTNDTPAADWYLKDFSGNGHDMQLYNYAKELNSGVGKYEENFTTWNKYQNVVVTKDKISVNSLYKNNWLVYKQSTTRIAPMKVKIIGIPANGRIEYRYMKSSSDTVPSSYNITEDGIHDLPESLALSGGPVGFMITPDLDWTHIEIIQIPDYEGALVSDGKDDYGQFVGDLGLKDYTIAVDRAYVEGLGGQVPIISSIGTTVNTPFLMEHMGVGKILAPHSFGTYTALSTLNTDRFISYQSTYKYNGDNLTKGTSTDTGSGLTIGRFGANNSQYAKLALWSLLLFPYSLSEFLLERQLKRYKLGTLYPDMVEFRPVISGNIPYNAIEISQGSTTLYNKSINKTGIYLQEGSTVRVYIQPSGIDEVSKITINGVEYTDLPINPNGYYYVDFPITKSPQKISYAIDEYIRYEDIVQPYPYIVKLRLGGHIYTYGDKLKVGETVQGIGWTNILDGLYEARTIWYNGINWGVLIKLVVAKQMVFTSDKRWLLDTSEPHAIYSPQKLNIPNSSLKILGYVPDLTGKGNHGKLNNFAYTEDSGVAADGSIKFDGTDDHITIPTLAHGGKCVMMKVNWSNNGMLYDQRLNSSVYTFGILTGEATLAYNARNNGSTYIDGILNANIIPSDLVGITHNITAVNDAAIDNNTVSPRLGVSVSNAVFSNQALYEFMLFPEIPSEDEIKKLNDVMGIEGGYVESPDYYWDAYGKSNSDADRATIIDQVSKEAANALTANNFAFNEESGYVNNSLVCDGVDDNLKNTNMPVLTDYTWIMKREILGINFCPVAYKGDGSTYLGGSMWFEQGGGCGSCSFGSTFVGGLTFPELISYQTKTSYNGTSIYPGTDIDGTKLVIASRGDDVQEYMKLVFYKAMLYTKTIDQLSINMLKNLFERDELIDVNNPIFKK